MTNWEYFKKFAAVNEEYLPAYGEGETEATQIVTAVNKLVYKWYNDGDVYDNTRWLTGWANDLSSYANWLYTYGPDIRDILTRIWDCRTGGEYEDLLRELADHTLDEMYLSFLGSPKRGSIYDCDGPFQFITYDEDEEDDDYDEEDDCDEDW